MSSRSNPAQIAHVEGLYHPPASARFAIIASRFNGFVVDALVSGACDTLRRHGVQSDRITLVQVPGAWELPWAAKRLATGGHIQAIIALGAVIRGATPHFDVVIKGMLQGLAAISYETSIPLANGVLTTDTIEQAIERAGSKAGNKGAEAATTAIELLSLDARLKDHGL